MTRTLSAIILLTTAALCYPQEQHRSAIDLCVDELKVPAYPLLARQAHLSGIAAITVGIGHGGRIDEVTVSGPHGVITQAARDAVMASKFSAHCNKTILQVIFDFQLAGPPGNYIQSEISFRPPNIFIIRTNRPRMEGSQ